MSFISPDSPHALLIEEFLTKIRTQPDDHRAIHTEFRPKGLIVPHRFSEEWYYLLYLCKTGKFSLEKKLAHFRLDKTNKIFVLLDKDEIIKDKQKPEWWTGDIEELVDKLWFPSGEKYQDPQNFNSWFTAKISNFGPQDNPTNPPLSEDERVIKISPKTGKPQPNSLKKIRIYPTTIQREKLRQCFDANRWAWNTILRDTKTEFYTTNIIELQKRTRPLVTKKTMIAPEYIKAAPEECFNSACRDLWKCHKTTIALSKSMKDKTGKGFKCKAPKWRTRKDKSQSIEIRARGIKIHEGGISFWPKFFGTEQVKIKHFVGQPEYTCRLQKTRTGQYYLIVPQFVQFDKSGATRTCAIDPGIRTMLTGYDPEGVIFEFGSTMEKITRRWVLVDKLKSRLREYHAKRNQRYQKKQRLLGIYAKITRMMRDCHHKTSKWISEHYNKVLLPFLKTKDIAAGKRLGPQVKRRLFAWSHYQFKELLKFKMERIGNCLVECTEEYTSKACTSCGIINRLLGSSKQFRCPFPNCGQKIDRDIGAARTIYLKNHQSLL